MLSPHTDDVAPESPNSDSLESTTLKPLDTVLVTRDYQSSASNVLSIAVGDILQVLSKSSTGWWDGVMVDWTGETVRGWFPSTYCRPATVETATRVGASGEVTTTVVGISASRKNSTVSFASSERSFDSGTGPKTTSGTTLSRPSYSSQLKHSITSTTSSLESLTRPRAVSAADVEIFFNNGVPVTAGKSSTELTPNFAPSWTPYLTESERLVYYNARLNVVTASLPFVEMPYVDAMTDFDVPEASIVDRMDAISISGISERDDESQSEKLNYQSMPLQRVSLGSEGSGPYSHDYSDRGVMLCEPDAFYYDPADIRNWNQMKAVVTIMVDFSLDALKKESKELFLSHLGTVSRLVTLLQLSARLLHRELAINAVETAVKRSVKRIMASLLQLTVNGTLHLTANKSSPHFMGNLESGSSSSDDREKQELDLYLERAEYDAHQLQRRSASLCDLFLTLELSSGKPNFYMPQVYPRFLKDEFDGGFFTNPIFQGEETSRKVFGPRILLDDDAIKTLENKKAELEKLLDDVIVVITTPVPMDTPVNQFEEERSISTTTLIYHAMPAINRVMQILESLDFTFFVMLRKLLANANERQSTEKETFGFDTQSDVDLDYQKEFDFEQHRSDDEEEPESGIDSEPLAESSTDLEQGPISESFSSFPPHSQTTSGSNTHFYEASMKMIEPTVEEFLEAKQQLYDNFVELVIDAQTLTLDDPEAFKGLVEDPQIDYNKSLKDTEIERLAKQLEERLIAHDLECCESGINDFDVLTKLADTIGKTKLRLSAIIEVSVLLKEQRSKITTYLSRLMDSDFDVAALFVAERHNTMYSSIASSMTDDYLQDRHAYTRADVDLDVPWFLEVSDEERDLVYDANGIKGGSKTGLVAKLCNPDHYGEVRGSFSSVDHVKLAAKVDDVAFAHALLLMFRTIFLPEEFLKEIIRQYTLVMPEGLSFEEYELWTAKRLVPTQAWVQEVLETLFSSYWNVHYSSPQVMETWKAFVADQAALGAPISTDLDNKVMTALEVKDQERYIKIFGRQIIREQEQSRPPAPLLFNRVILKRGKISLREIEALELARQFSLIQFELYEKINETELLSRAWSRKYGEIGDSPNIASFVRNCNQITHFTSYSVLRKTDARKRAEIIKYLILVAEKCLKLKNFSTMTAIISGLGSTQISRLKKTWALVPKHMVRNFERLDSVMSFGRNYSEYRSMLRFMEDDNEPCLPFLGMYLSDLRFLADGNRDYLQDKQTINFGKRLGLARIISDAVRPARRPFNFERVEEIQTFIQEYFDAVPDEETMYQLSLKLEPRVAMVKGM
ncbi:unnamed protein product [Kuraishia capsulata CBS 1993]|uniref:SH3 domain-containing protein n=1 Tax=Kuraishia capsulata CBS 1993 TaxID=1382522 RepID=W6MMM9_9ASCO|nr:uncharacterized protein KUCA_T00003441001 [Kuraishia capsulata CBS 1993]CDK27463.1 unnamed protein product [Kuraishia capsulata CBS 1993]